jgi:hypothetical protein
MGKLNLNWPAVVFVAVLVSAYVVMRVLKLDIPVWLDSALFSVSMIIAAATSLRKGAPSIPPPPEPIHEEMRKALASLHDIDERKRTPLMADFDSREADTKNGKRKN